MNRLSIGKVLRGLRKAKGITQEQLSEILGVSSAAISKWENEQMYPDISFFPVLARYFNVSIDCLFGFSNELSEEEYLSCKKECTELFEAKEYMAGIEKIKALSYLYPTNDRLKIDLAISVLPYLALAEDAAIRDKTAFQIISICQGCTDKDIQVQKNFVLTHLFMLVGQYQGTTLNANLKKDRKDVVDIDMTNSWLIRTEESNVIEKINSTIVTLSIQLMYELRNKASYLKKVNDLQGALEILKKQCNLVELLELDSNLYCMIYMHMAYIYCLLGENAEARKNVGKFVALLKKLPIVDNVLFQVYKTGFSSTPFDAIKKSSEFKELEVLLS